MLDSVKHSYTSNSIVVFDPDTLSRSSITTALNASGYLTIEASDHSEAYQFIEEQEPCMLIFNWDTPKVTGAGFMKKVREESSYFDIPTLVITECCDAKSRIESLECGSDDCMSKPLSPHELILRVNSILRRTRSITEKTPRSTIKVNGLVLDASNLSLRVDGKDFYLNASDFRLLHFLMSKRGEVVTRQDLREISTGQQAELDERSIDVYIMRLRKVLKQYGQDHLIQTVRGVGYRLVA